VGSGLSAGPRSATVVSRMWVFPARDRQVACAPLIEAVVAVGPHRTERRADADVTWRLRRPAGERVPAGAHLVRVSEDWTAPALIRWRERRRRCRRSPDCWMAWGDGPGVGSCIAEAVPVTLALSAAGPALLGARDSWGCADRPVAVRLGRRRPPTLSDPRGALARAAPRAAGLPAPGPLG